MELRHLRYLCAVADHGTFSEAGRQLHISQSAISEQIADLEREVGGALIDRTSSRTRLTPQGRLFLDEARKTLVAADRRPRDHATFAPRPGRFAQHRLLSPGVLEASSPASFATTASSTPTSSSPSTRCALPSRWRP